MTIAYDMLRDKINVESNTRFLIAVRDFVSRMIRASKIHREDENKVILAVDEAVSNIIEHAYEFKEDGSIEIEVEANEKEFRVFIRDSGKSFDPDSLPDININENVKRGKKRGLGIFLMRKIMDEVRYNFRDSITNELLLVKYIK